MIRKIVGTTVTSLLVAVALALAAWWVYSAVFGATLISFRTGSMAPTMPQGSVAVTVPVSAPDIEVGDVLTVQRATETMPVTHRVIEISEVQPRAANEADIRATAPRSGPGSGSGSAPPDLSSSDARQIVMQGDDNDTPDQLPYALTDARRVVFAVPALGTALMMLQTPIAMGALVLLVAALVVWAFWPKRKGDAGDGSASESGATTARDPGAVAGTASAQPGRAEPANTATLVSATQARHAAEVLP